MTPDGGVTAWKTVARKTGVAVVFLVLSVHWAVDLYAARLQDLDVYLAAARDVLAGRDPYAPRPALPYTYPPVWALLCLPLVFVPVWLAKTVVFTGSLAVAVLLVRHLARGMPRPLLWGAAAMFAAPISRTLYQGQVNLLIAGLVLLDYVVLTNRARGIGIGVAAAVKLAPAFLALPFLVRRDWRSLARALATFVVMAGAAYLVVPGPSIDYWRHHVWNSSRVGGVAFADNQSVLGTLLRFTDTGTAHLLFGVLAIPVLALVVAAVRRQVRQGRVLGQVAAAGIGATLISPVSWSHHWIWLILASAVLVRLQRQVLGLVVLVPLVIEPAWIANLLPPGLPPVIGASLLGLTPVAALVCLFVLARADPAGQPVRVTPATRATMAAAQSSARVSGSQ